jgi:ABC-type dipeptide/oligopeptide/nickel transport system permease subunit
MGTFNVRRLLQAAIIMLAPAVFPGVALLSTVLGVTFLGDGLGDALDARWR